jgi:CubicO group peptidase (beta-lactamase class C family)
MSLNLDSLRGFISESRALWKDPGVAVGIVQGDSVVLCEGFGLSDIANSRPVTPSTLFAIGSATKSFTAFALGLLVDQGRLDWDQPVRKYVPAFKLYDPVASERATPRDLLSHRTGLPRHDMIWYNSPRSRQELFDRLQYLEPNKDLRQEYQYQNLMFMAAGIVLEGVTGQTWEEFVRERIFGPLGMARSNFSVDVLQTAGDFARGHQETQRQIQLIPYRNIDHMGPAGSINSSAEEMVAWLRVQLSGGRLGEQPIISGGTLSQMHTPQMVIHEPSLGPEMLPASYGLGWFIVPYRGHQMIYHPGGIDGFTALVALLPDEKTGVVVLSNLGGSWLPGIIAFRVLDEALGMEPVDWSSRMEQQHEQSLAAQNQGEDQLADGRKEGRPPAHALEEYAGEYEHPGYGVIAVDLRGDTLRATLNGIEYEVAPYHYEVFQFSYEMQGTQHLLAIFSADVQGNVNRLSMPLEPAVREIVFERIPDRRLSSRDFLDQLAGEYTVKGMPLTVALLGDRLVASVPGQPTLELEAYRGSTFNVKGMAGFSVTFKQDASGKVAELEFVQPGAVLTGKRVE